MARKVTTDDIKQFNELYYQHKSYAEVARITGWSSSTVSKYVDKNYTPINPDGIRKFDVRFDLPEFNTDIFLGDWSELCEYTEEEEMEMRDFWEELSV